MNRRRFLAVLAAVGAAAGGAWAWLRRRPRVEETAASEAPRAPDGRPVFPERYREALAALCNVLVPDEPDAPGAAELGAYRYLEREAARPEMQGARRILLRGATQLDVGARAQFGGVFAALPAADQERVVHAMLGGAGAKGTFDPAEFVRLTLALTLEGMFGDPAHGGNRDERGWQYLRYAMHPPRPDACGGQVCR
ncbi:MAG: gluconate 2-dehydrogenase subunit 3 family protein [Deltaproteobacteria bacterium]|nr:gluconate 2-dehydrogenase subunit 3 family protein [Deltaproteobacteria bacterium]